MLSRVSSNSPRILPGINDACNIGFASNHLNVTVGFARVHDIGTEVTILASFCRKINKTIINMKHAHFARTHHT